MGILRKASAETKRIQLGDEDYIEVKADISQRDFERLLSRLPEDMSPERGLRTSEGLEAQHAMFEMFDTGWSLTEPATLEVFSELTPDAARAINDALAEHFNSLPLNQQEAKKPTT